MFNLKIFNKTSTEILTIKNDLKLNSEIELINKYNISQSENYKKAIFLIFKERGYSSSEINRLLESNL